MRVRFGVAPEVAFDWFADPANRPRWQSSLRRVDDIVGEPGPGQGWVDVTWPGLRPQMRTTRYERPRLWAETGGWRGYAADLTMRFEPDAGGCVADIEFEVRGPLGRLLTLAAGPAVRADVRRAARVLNPGN